MHTNIIIDCGIIIFGFAHKRHYYRCRYTYASSGQFVKANAQNRIPKSIMQYYRI